MVKLFLSNFNQINRDVAVKEGKTEQCQICFQKRAILRPEGHVTRGFVKRNYMKIPIISYLLFSCQTSTMTTASVFKEL